MALIDGDEFVSGDILSYQQGNRLKDNWVQSDPKANLGSPQEGMLVFDSDDGRVYIRKSTTYAGVWTLDAPFPWANLFGNSGIGYWSQSDTNKGLATLVYDNLVGGNFGVGDTITGATSGAVGKLITDNGATSMTLGAVSGTFQDNEQIGNGAGVTADVNGDLNIGIKNDPMSDDSTGDWTEEGAGIVLADNVGEYTVTTTAGNQRAWIAAAALTAGKIYKIELDIKDGSAAGEDIEGYFDDGAAQYGAIKVTAAGWVSVSWVFECVTTTGAGKVGFRIPTSLGGNDIEIRRFSCYEITPCCTGADDLAFDGKEWTKDATLDLYRQHWDGGTLTQDGSFYSLKCVPSAVDDYINWRYDVYDFDEHLAQFHGRTVTIGMWVKTSTASHFRIHIYEQGGASAASNFHTGGGTWEWIEVSYTFGTTSTWLYMQLRFSQAANVDGSTIVYISQPMLIFGDAIGEGNYAPKSQEFIWGEKVIPSNVYDGLLLQSDLAFTDINLEADSDSRIPKGAKVIAVHTSVDDSGSGAGLDVHLELRKDATAGTFYINSVAGKPNDVHNHQAGLQPCDVNGDVDIHLDATGANTLNINMFEYHGVQVN